MNKQEYYAREEDFKEMRMIKYDIIRRFYKKYDDLTEYNLELYATHYQNKILRSSARYNLRLLMEMWYANKEIYKIATKRNKASLYGLYCYNLRESKITIEGIEKICENWDYISKSHRLQQKYFRDHMTNFYNLLIKTEMINGELTEKAFSKLTYNKQKEAKAYGKMKAIEWKNFLNYDESKQSGDIVLNDGTCFNVAGFIQLMQKINEVKYYSLTKNKYTS